MQSVASAICDFSLLADGLVTQGGAVNDVPADGTAYGHRDALYYMQTYGIGLTGLNPKTRTFLNGINDNIRKAMPGVDFGAYAGYVE